MLLKRRNSLIEENKSGKEEERLRVSAAVRF